MQSLYLSQYLPNFKISLKMFRTQINAFFLFLFTKYFRMILKIIFNWFVWLIFRSICLTKILKQIIIYRNFPFIFEKFLLLSLSYIFVTNNKRVINRSLLKWKCIKADYYKNLLNVAWFLWMIIIIKTKYKVCASTCRKKN